MILLTIILTLLVFAEISVARNVIESEVFNATTFNPNVCLSEACHQEASKVLSKMDKSIDPCDDFYEYACGKFLNTTTIPDDQTRVSSFTTAQLRLERQLKQILMEPISDDNNNTIAPFQHVRNLYKACMNTDLIKKRGKAPVEKALNSMGGWPVVVGSSWESFSWSWENASYKAFKKGFSPNFLFEFAVDTDDFNSSKRILVLDQPTFYYNSYQSYRRYLYTLPIFFGANRTRAKIEMDKVNFFERSLIRISATETGRKYLFQVYKPMNITTLQSSYPFVNWLDFLNQFFPEGNKLSGDDVVVVRDANYFKRLGELIENTGKRTLANYAMYRMAYESYRILPEILQPANNLTMEGNLTMAANTMASNVTKESELKPDEKSTRSTACIAVVSSKFPRVLGSLYVRKYFKKSSKAEAVEMINNIKDEFEKTLNAVDWMDDKTKEAAKLKLKKMKYQIGFAEELMDNSKLLELSTKYNLNIDQDEYFESSLNIRSASMRHKFEIYRTAVDKTNWIKFVTPISVDAFYYVDENTMKFPAAILQGEFFSNERPQYMNYGGIGYIMGHELTHGFDTIGGRYNADGDLENWWATETKKSFLEKAKCLTDQYWTIVEPSTKLQLRGVSVLPENIADNGGIKLSYRAYVRWSKKNPEPQLPNLNFTCRQMFWISAAQTWCHVYRKDSLSALITTDVHSPSRFRINVPLSNSKEFSNDFQCPLGTLMNPRKKCEVW